MSEVERLSYTKAWGEGGGGRIATCWFAVVASSRRPSQGSTEEGEEERGRMEVRCFGTSHEREKGRK
jgi:hypothetical protein